MSDPAHRTEEEEEAYVVDKRTLLRKIENCDACGLDHSMAFTRLYHPYFIDGKEHRFAGVCPQNREMVYLRFEFVDEEESS